MYKMLSARGWRKAEPLPIPAESPEALSAVVETHRRDHGYTTDDLSRVSLLRRDEFERIYRASSSDGPDPERPTKRLRVVS
jgi:hypothetical protein